MASTNGSIVTNEVEGRSLTLNWSKASESIANNKTIINYSIIATGSWQYYVSCGPITVTINGETVYSIDANHRVDAYQNQVLKSGTLEISHENDGSKSFSASISAAIYLFSVNATASGSWTLPTINRYPNFTTNPSVTAKTETSVTIDRGATDLNSNFYYSLNNSTWTKFTSQTATITGLNPNTSYTVYVQARNSAAESLTANKTVSVKTYANVSQSLVSKTVNSITMKWSLDTEADYIWYSIGSGWVGVGSVNAKTGTYTITGLSPNTDYNVYVKARRKLTQTTSDTLGNPVAVKTYDIAKITGSANWTIGNNTSVAYTNPSGASISIGIFNTAGNVAYASYRTPSSSPYTFNFTSAENTALYNSIPNSTSGIVRIYLRTSVNGTSYYDYADKTISVNESICKPTFSDFYYEDTDTNVTALTNYNKILVNGYSDPVIVVWQANKAVAKNGASMVKYRVKIRNQTIEKAYSSSGDEYLGTISNITSPTIEVSAIDSRGLETKITKTAIWKDYKNISITKMELKRENAIGTKVFFDFEADYWNGNFGATENVIDNVKFRYMPKGGSYSDWIDITNSIQYSNGKVTTIDGSFLPTTNNGSTPIEFVVGTVYYVQFHIDDSTKNIQSTNSQDQYIDDGKPCTDKYKDSNGNYHVGINQLADPNYTLAVSGTIKSSGSMHAVIFNPTGMQQLNSNINLNNIKDFYRVYYCNACTNMPTTTNGYLKVHKVNDNYVMQEFTTITNYSYIRTCYNGTWGAWRQIDNIVGSGSNANGSYLQFSDGTMICWYSYRVTASNSKFATSYGSIYHNGATTWTFPVKFTGVPKIIATAYLKGGIGGFNITTVPNDTAIAGYEYSFTSYDFGAGNAGVDFVAIGRWK